MTNKFFTLTLLCAATFSLLAQKHDYNWILGENCDAPDAVCTRHVSFEQLPPKAEAWNDQISYLRSTAMTCSDSSGHPIFRGWPPTFRPASFK